MYGYYLLWKYAKQLYNEQIAEDIIIKQFTKRLYINDFHNFGGIPYCFAFSMLDLMQQGIQFGGKVKSQPAKHMSSFMGHVIAFLTYSCQQLSGACSMPDILVITSFFVDKLFNENKNIPKEYLILQIKQELQGIIYQFNQPFRGALQSAFTNVSIYDSNFLDKICYEYIFPDGSKPNKKTIQFLQNLFLDLMNKTLDETIITFPIITACFATDDNNKVLDEEFLDFISEKNLKYGFINIFAGKTSITSACCFHPEQKIMVKNSDDGVIYDTFETVYNKKRQRNLTGYHNGSWVKGKFIKKHYIGDLYKITTKNNKEMIITENHLLPTINGDIYGKNLNTEDYLLTNSRQINSFPEQDKHLTYEQGYLIGLYLGDGSKYYRSNTWEITLSLNENDVFCKKIVKKALKDWNAKNKIAIYRVKNNVVFFKFYSKKVFNEINKWVRGNYSYEKELNLNVILQSADFRKGIIDGWYQSDGGNSNRIYSTSQKLIEHGEVLCSSLGINTIVNVSDRTGEGQVKIRGKLFNRNYPLYCLRFYGNANKRLEKNVYIVKNNSVYFKIKTIEKIENYNGYVYCFECSRKSEPYFTLPNNIITHNCRLRVDSKNDYFNTFGSGSNKIGSLSVTTLNLPRLAYLSKNKEEFIEYLKEDVEAASRINNVKRKMLEKNIEKGYLPLYTLNFMNLNKQYSTCGINGLYEALEILGFDILKEDGQLFVEAILNTINEVNDKQAEKFNAPHNSEIVPAESAAYKLAEADKLLGYNKDYILYSNQFIPLTVDADIFDRIELQGKFDKRLSGGAILHLNFSERIPNKEMMKKFIKLSIENGVVYHAINYLLSKCNNNHVTIENSDACSICGEKIIEKYERIVGYLAPVNWWNNKRKIHDHPNRVRYEEKDTK
jgi:anaerobic ribonucleoside-triphosphate reductase